MMLIKSFYVRYTIENFFGCFFVEYEEQVHNEMSSDHFSADSV